MPTSSVSKNRLFWDFSLKVRTHSKDCIGTSFVQIGQEMAIYRDYSAKIFKLKIAWFGPSPPP